MTYILVVYYSWVLGLAGWIAAVKRGRPRMGIALIAAAALIQMTAHGIHVLESYRLRGEPDALYTWVAPLLIAIVGSSCWVSGLVVSLVPRRSTSESRRVGT